MCTILMSINPEHVKNILSGNKEYEFRKVSCRKSIDKIIIYSTFPVMKIVGEAKVKSVITGSPDSVWNITKNKSGITKKYFDSYFKGKKIAIAYNLGEVIKYNTPKRLTDVGVNKAPQSFQYLDI